MNCQWCKVDLLHRRWYLWDNKPQCENKEACGRRSYKNRKNK